MSTKEAFGMLESSELRPSSVFNMGIVRKWNKKWLIITGVFAAFALFYIMANVSMTDDLKYRTSSYKTKYSVWPQFQSTSPLDSIYFRSECVRNGNYSITGLTIMLKEWAKSRNYLCREYYKKFTSIFTVEARKATLNLPVPFQTKVRKWLANNDDLYKEVYSQDIIHIVSEYTREHTVFNPLRDKRPVMPPEIPESDYFNDILKKTAENCDFCNFKNFTAEHTFGRVESEHAFSASNIFKIDTFHALMALKKHDPLNWNLEELVDLFQLTQTWILKAHSHNSQAKFPALVWDILPKCGASQVHPHMHVILDLARYPGEVETWRKGAQEYFIDHNSNYFSDLVAVYSGLNLTAKYGSAVAFASLVPRKDHEVVVMARKPDSDFYTLLFFVLRAFIDDLNIMCFSMGIGFPAIDTKEGKLPVYARAITRGYITDIRADISSLEMFLATNVNIDPYKTIELVRNSVKKRST